MNIILGKSVKVKETFYDININILPYLYHHGIIVGKKQVDQKPTIFIIEFRDSTRIWMLNQELILKQKIKSII